MNTLSLPSNLNRALARRLAIAALVIAALGVAGVYARGVDYRPLVTALRLELHGFSAYGPEMDRAFKAGYAGICEDCASAGFAYPLPAIWLVLPIVALPETAARAVWCIMQVGSVLLGLRLLRMPLQLALYMPLVVGAYIHQSTVLLIGLTLLGVWAWRERRWWLLGAFIALTIAAKPQATLVLALGLAVLMLRAGAWRPLLVCGAVLAAATFAIEPAWPLGWLAVLDRYRGVNAPVLMLWWLPSAALLWWLRRRWAALALLQLALLPTTFGYTLLPLLVGYVDAPGRRTAWIAVAASWLALPLLRYGLGWPLAATLTLALPLLLACLPLERFASAAGNDDPRRWVL